jgi:hypothetical protein
VEDKKKKGLKREVNGGRKKENKKIVAFQISKTDILVNE